MAKATAKGEVSGSESESDHLKSTKKTAATSKTVSTNKGRDADAEDVEMPEENGDEEDEEEEEEEYEIEAILDAKHGTFPGGRVGYLVKWKGYPEENNSWVDEKDAEGAMELIKEYWKTHNKKHPPRKAEPKAKSTPKPRKSSAAAKTDESDVEEVAPPPPAKKRGRPPKARTATRSISEDQEQDEDEEESLPKKKPRKSTGATNGAKSASAKRALAVGQEEEEEYADMRKFKNASTWEQLVDTIDTVERTEDGLLLVYFTLKNGKGHGKEKSDICKKKMPYKLIDFYESNLRWKPTEEDAMEE